NHPLGTEFLICEFGVLRVLANYLAEIVKLELVLEISFIHPRVDPTNLNEEGIIDSLELCALKLLMISMVINNNLSVLSFRINTIIHRAHSPHSTEDITRGRKTGSDELIDYRHN